MSSTNKSASPPPFSSQRRQSAQGSGVDQPAPHAMSGYRTTKRENDEDYVAEASGFPGVEMPNVPKAEREGRKMGEGDSEGRGSGSGE